MRLYTFPIMTVFLIVTGLTGLGEAVDIGASALTGGEGKTISARTGEARQEGSKLAKVACGAYNVSIILPLHDHLIRWTGEQIEWMDAKVMAEEGRQADHCDYRRIGESEEFRAHFGIDHRDDWDNLNR